MITLLNLWRLSKNKTAKSKQKGSIYLTTNTFNILYQSEYILEHKTSIENGFWKRDREIIFDKFKKQLNCKNFKAFEAHCTHCDKYYVGN